MNLQVGEILRIYLGDEHYGGSWWGNYRSLNHRGGYNRTVPAPHNRFVTVQTRLRDGGEDYMYRFFSPSNSTMIGTILTSDCTGFDPILVTAIFLPPPFKEVLRSMGIRNPRVGTYLLKNYADCTSFPTGVRP